MNPGFMKEEVGFERECTEELSVLLPEKGVTGARRASCAVSRRENHRTSNRVEAK